MNKENNEKTTDSKKSEKAYGRGHMRRDHREDHRMFREGRSGRYLNRRQSHIRNAMFRRESHKEMLELFILETIQENPNTGYQMQTKFNIPRGTLTRHLDKMETNEQVTSEKTEIKGRTQKIFTITEKGADHLEALRENWAIRGEMLDELGPFEDSYGRPPRHKHPPRGPPGSRRRHNHHHRRRLDPPFEEFLTKDQALDFFRGERSRINHIHSRLSTRLANAEEARSELDSLIEKIESMKEFSTEELKQIFEPPHDQQ
ncbi:MAG: PadR family transcriptional regulator [Promethearchaeota archaeon]